MQDKSIGVFYAKTHLSALLEQVSKGNTFTVTKHGQPVAKIVPVHEPDRRPQRGAAKSPDFYMAPDFDEPLEDFAEYM